MIRTGILIGAIFMAGCAEKLRVDATASRNAPARWERLLSRAVLEDGRVRYDLLTRRRVVLDTYMAWAAEHGPISDSYPYSKEDRAISFLANTYNASVILGVIENQPLSSVRDVRKGLYLAPAGAGFFAGQQFRIDGQWVNLYTLEHQYLLGQFEDPFIHVMLNCASKGCPPLRYWSEADLDEQVEQALTDFLASEQGIRRVEGTGLDGEFALSELFLWYADHFEDWSTAESVCAFLVPYAEPAAAAWLESEHQAGCTPATFEYDWSLNGAETD